MTSPNGAPPGASDAASRAAAHAASDATAIESVGLANGIVLRLRPVPPFLLRKAATLVPRPDAPKVWIESKGVDRSNPEDAGWEVNPDNPEFKMALAEWANDSNEASLRVLLIAGTEVESIPDDYYRPEADEWIAQVTEPFTALGHEPPEIHVAPQPARYLDWLMLYAIPSEEDVFRLTNLLLQGNAISEEELRTAVDSFRGAKARGADFASALVTQLANGDLDPSVDAGDRS